MHTKIVCIIRCLIGDIFGNIVLPTARGVFTAGAKCSTPKPNASARERLRRDTIHRVTDTRKHTRS